MNNLTDLGLLIFRVLVGAFMMFGHGLGKLTRLLGGEEIKFFDPLGLGMAFSLTLSMIAEFFFAALIILGLFTRLSSAVLIINMAVAAFLYHAADPFGTKEKALLYLAGFILLFLAGPGRYSVQKFIAGKFENAKGFKKFLLS